ncbi:hypothetical protein NP233_g10920 [Leucocoprinus birnbaumii]|uniref:F-box domain-containing protein n=1 Tax=Leucocoprinus birnbaumii TaxID=56174 RepID=A0AAD5VHY8_9AGAR|nr:hypothetical protein NP233_g10920 [Leucocoprinus birnbaumii]
MPGIEEITNGESAICTERVAYGEVAVGNGGTDFDIPIDLTLMVLESLPMRDLVKFQAVNHELRALATSVVQQRTDNMLGRFIDPVSLMEVMRETKAVISGSSVLLLLTDATFVPSDLDVYIQAKYVDRFLSYISTHGYTENWCRDANVTDYGQEFLEIVYRFSKSAGPAETTTVINVISTSHSPLAPILDFDLTHVINALTPFGIICFYPMFTFLKRGVANQIPVAPSRRAKYWERGFEEVNINRLSSAEESFLKEVRHVHDGRSAFIPFQADLDRDVWFDEELENMYWIFRNDNFNFPRESFILDGKTRRGFVEEGSMFDDGRKLWIWLTPPDVGSTLRKEWEIGVAAIHVHDHYTSGNRYYNAVDGLEDSRIMVLIDRERPWARIRDSRGDIAHEEWPSIVNKLLLVDIVMVKEELGIDGPNGPLYRLICTAGFTRLMPRVCGRCPRRVGL